MISRTKVLLHANRAGYILPATTVRALGGAHVFDNLVEQTTGWRPSVINAIPIPHGLLKLLHRLIQGGG